MRTFARLFFVAVLVSALTPPVPVQANLYEVETDYYVGCTNPTFAGESDVFCDGQTYSYGTLAGDWKIVYKTNCGTEVLTAFYYENCGGGNWIPVSQASWGQGCQC